MAAIQFPAGGNDPVVLGVTDEQFVAGLPRQSPEGKHTARRDVSVKGTRWASTPNKAASRCLNAATVRLRVGHTASVIAAREASGKAPGRRSCSRSWNQGRHPGTEGARKHGVGGE